jgi:hypothetical protein
MTTKNLNTLFQQPASVLSHKFIVIVRLDPEASPGQAAIQNSLKRLDSVLRLDRGIKSGNDVVVELCNLLMGLHTSTRPVMVI